MYFQACGGSNLCLATYAALELASCCSYCYLRCADHPARSLFRSWDINWVVCWWAIFHPRSRWLWGYRLLRNFFSFLYIVDGLNWSINTTAFTKKAQQCLYFQQRLRKVNSLSSIMTTFHKGTMETILTLSDIETVQTLTISPCREWWEQQKRSYLSFSPPYLTSTKTSVSEKPPT